MSHTPNFDRRISAILASLQPRERVCALTGEKWFETQEEIDQLKKYQVPPHPWAPMVRMKHLMGFPSGIAIWKKPHAETGKPILSFVHPDSPFGVIEDKEWFSRDFIRMGDVPDVSVPFFESFKKLAHSVPVGALRSDGSNINTIGVDMLDTRDSYYIFGGYGMSRMLYAAICYKEENSVLMTNTKGVNESFHCNAVEQGHNLIYAIQCGSCMDSAFLFNCEDCVQCFGATNQRHKKFIFFNEQLTQEEYERRISAIDLSSQSVWDEYVARYHDLVRASVWRPQFNFNVDAESSGEEMIHTTRCRDCYWLDGGVDLYRCWVGVDARDSYQCVWLGWGSDQYLSTDLVENTNVKFCMRVWRSLRLEYCMDCYDCEDCFGCMGLCKKKFHIFNVPFSEADYWQRIDEIKCAMLERGEYGLFFPAELSQQGFQFSMGNFFLGYTDEELKQFGASLFDPTKGSAVDVAGSIHASDLPVRLDDANEAAVVGRPILDEALNRTYTILPQEFAFYKRKRLPLPRTHFLTRLTNLIRHFNMPIPEETQCAKCKTALTVYKNATFPERIIYCMPCYLKYRESTVNPPPFLRRG